MAEVQFAPKPKVTGMLYYIFIMCLANLMFLSEGDTNLLPLLELDKRHHRHNLARGDFPESHVYALISTSPYVKNKDVKEIEIVIPIGPIQIIVSMRVLVCN